jgi:hypothetical protein
LEPDRGAADVPCALYALLHAPASGGAGTSPGTPCANPLAREVLIAFALLRRPKDTGVFRFQQARRGPHMLKAVLWIILAIFIIGLLVVFGVLDFIF